MSDFDTIRETLVRISPIPDWSVNERAEEALVALSRVQAASEQTEKALADPERVARLFHESYERLAPQFAYRTRQASAVPFDDVPENNRNLMIAAAGEVCKELTVLRDKDTR